MPCTSAMATTSMALSTLLLPRCRGRCKDGSDYEQSARIHWKWWAITRLLVQRLCRVQKCLAFPGPSERGLRRRQLQRYCARLEGDNKVNLSAHRVLASRSKAYLLPTVKPREEAEARIAELSEAAQKVLSNPLLLKTCLSSAQSFGEKPVQPRAFTFVDAGFLPAAFYRHGVQGICSASTVSAAHGTCAYPGDRGSTFTVPPRSGWLPKSSDRHQSSAYCPQPQQAGRFQHLEAWRILSAEML